MKNWTKYIFIAAALFLGCSTCPDLAVDNKGYVGIKLKNDLVFEVFPESPADKAGVKTGDRILAINNESTGGWSMTDIAEKLMGTIGTSVSISLERQGKRRYVVITRARAGEQLNKALIKQSETNTNNISSDPYLNSIVNVWDYSGVIDKVPFNMTLIRDPASYDDIITSHKASLKGSYCYPKQLKDILLDGNIDDKGNITLYQYDASGKESAIFNGRSPAVCHGDGTFIDGIWTKIGASQSKPFTLSLDSSTSRSRSSGRYAVADIDNDTIFEKRVQQFQKAVIDVNKPLVASSIHYPIFVSITFNGKKVKRKIGDKEQLLNLYNKIFYPGFVDGIKAAVAHNMFVNSNGVMLADGLVWFGADGKVTALNN